MVRVGLAIQVSGESASDSVRWYLVGVRPINPGGREQFGGPIEIDFVATGNESKRAHHPEAEAKREREKENLHLQLLWKDAALLLGVPVWVSNL